VNLRGDNWNVEAEAALVRQIYRSPIDDPELGALLAQAWDASRSRHGNRLNVHIPGMFVVNGVRGRYRAVSITGTRCDLDCEHCKGLLLRTMPPAPDPETLLRLGLEAKARGDYGMLITGGCDASGRLPWQGYLQVIRKLKATTDLTITVHAGQVDLETGRGLKDSGVDQALVDVMGDDATARGVYHLAEGTAQIRRTLDSLAAVGLEIVPHILFGIHYGMERGERAALEILSDYPLKQYVVVVIMPFRGTPMEGVQAPRPEQVASFLASARLRLPDLCASLGCARPRGRYRHALDVLAVRAGINSLALPSDAALEYALRHGLEVVHSATCCSLSAVGVTK
jgi:lipoyl synthase